VKPDFSKMEAAIMMASSNGDILEILIFKDCVYRNLGENMYKSVSYQCNTTDIHHLNFFFF